MQAYPWPGNIRELINVIERGTILATKDVLLPEDLPAHIQNYSPGKDTSQILCSLSEMEKTHITEVLRHTDSLEDAAKVLGIDPTTLWRKRKKYHLD
jgi:NtrC-family two-component system response regulator AlgB